MSIQGNLHFFLRSLNSRKLVLEIGVSGLPRKKLLCMFTFLPRTVDIQNIYYTFDQCFISIPMKHQYTKFMMISGNFWFSYDFRGIENKIDSKFVNALFSTF